MTIGQLEIKRTETRNLPVKLREDELLERGHSLASVIQDITSEEARQVDVKAQMKARLSELEARRSQLAIVVSRREEQRDVTCDVFHDYDRVVVETVRRDTGEVVYSRAMTEDERQLPLPAGV